MKQLYFGLIFIISSIISSVGIPTHAQTPYANTTADIVLVGGAGTGTNRSGVAYNPSLDIYYANIAGNSSYMLETFSSTGALLSSVVSNVDIRGLWWNPLLNQLELNTYNGQGIYQKTLDPLTGYATATNVGITVPTNVIPNIQSAGQYDWVNNHFIYYNNNQIIRVNRATNTIVSTNTITGLPSTNITLYQVGFFNVPNYEIALYDYTNRRVYFVNGSTYAYTHTTQLPTTATSVASFNVGFANNRIFICNTSARTWTGYPLFPDVCYDVDTVRAAICDNQTYTVGTKTYNQSGFYADTFQTNGQCDSVVHTFLTVNPTYRTSIYDSIYVGQMYSFNNNQYGVSGTYVANYASENGCDSIITLNLKVIPFQSDTIRGEVCTGDTLYYENYVFTRSGIYRDTLMNERGHTFRTFIITINPRPNIRLSSTSDLNNLCIGDSITLELTGADTFKWSYVEHPFNRHFYTGKTLETKVFGFETQYIIEGITDDKCKAIQEFSILGKDCCTLLVPNAFSPNNDGLNDEFEVLGKQPLEFMMEVFDRYGRNVFKSNSTSSKWTGNDLDGKPLSSDVYYYYIKGKCYDGSIIDKKGSIHIIR